MTLSHGLPLKRGVGTFQTTLLILMILGSSVAAIGQPLTIVSPVVGTIYAGDVGIFYNPLFNISASGGTPPYIYSVVGAPSWISINPATGVAAGMAPSAGSYVFT